MMSNFLIKRLWHKTSLLSLTLLLMLSLFPGESQVSAGETAVQTGYRNLGTAVKKILGIGGAPFVGTDGRQYISGTVNGLPAQFVIIDALTLEVVQIIDIPETSSTSTALAGADGNVYIGTTGSGLLYRYVPGATELELLGKPIASETHIFGLANGPDGKIYGGTYPNGKLFEYDPATQSFTDWGTQVAGEQYLRKLVYDPERDLIIAGTGTSSRLVEIDLNAGTVSDNILPDAWSVEEYPNSIDLIGDKIFVQLNKSVKMVVIDKWTHVVEKEYAVTSAHAIPSHSGEHAYVFSPGDAYLHKYDLQTGESEAVERFGRFNSWKSAVIFEGGTAEAPEYILSAYMGYDAVLTYNLTTGERSSINIDVPGQPILIRSIFGGPDGKVYISGSQGGTGIYDPATDTMVSKEHGLSQAEGITTYGDHIYFGVYPYARLSVFDTKQPWLSGTNPVEVGRLPADDLQDRPFAMLGVEEVGKVFMGTVPQYGHLGGAFAIYDVESQEFVTHRNVVADHSIITLAYKDGKVYGGTSIWGAYGAPHPTDEAGKLFVWDVESGQKELELVPVAGKDAVTSLIVGPDGHLWGFNEGILFIYDLDEQEVIYEAEVIPVHYQGTVWADAYMLIGQDGDVYATAWGYFFKIDAETKDITILDRAMQFSNLAQDRNGYLYMRSSIEENKHELWQYIDPAWLEPAPPEGPGTEEPEPGDGDPEQPEEPEEPEESEGPEESKPEVPAWPDQAQLIITEMNRNGLKLAWPAASSKTGIESYNVYVEDELYTSVTADVYDASVSNLPLNKPVSLSVRAKATTGELSAPLRQVVQLLVSSQGGYSYVPPASDHGQQQENEEASEPSKLSEPSLPAYTDVAGHWGEAAIARARELGLVRGYDDGSFRPEARMTRAEFAVVLMRLLTATGTADGEVEANRETNNGRASAVDEGFIIATFTDRDLIGSWAQASIEQATTAGIMQGYPDGSFKPNQAITRAELAVMLARIWPDVVDIEINRASFTDMGDIPEWAAVSIERMHSLGLIQGHATGRFAPNERATRAEATTILLRLYDMLNVNQ